MAGSVCGSTRRAWTGVRCWNCSSQHFGCRRRGGLWRSSTECDVRPMLDPLRYKTWTFLHEHPACAAGGERVYEWYVHVDPRLPIDQQRAIADEDLRNLSATCAAIEREFGAVRTELAVLDDYTTYARIENAHFEVEIHPGGNRGERGMLMAFVQRPGPRNRELRAASPDDLVRQLKFML